MSSRDEELFSARLVGGVPSVGVLTFAVGEAALHATGHQAIDPCLAVLIVPVSFVLLALAQWWTLRDADDVSEHPTTVKGDLS